LSPVATGHGNGATGPAEHTLGQFGRPIASPAAATRPCNRRSTHGGAVARWVRLGGRHYFGAAELEIW